ncbi:Nramp family divalent metal transporter [Streptomyces sp. S465]|uniref:Nramp family divalent metal transporter n=1 Tax=Streptomyces sp. S465 TaxID=2979468 RepID=UPI0022A8306F|nr:Nramp family divalent metal transporter [Streptomyces sp. S465]WAP53818.1 Nramp family divalent metal transporter [Streptomyces sp. S465]
MALSTEQAPERDITPSTPRADLSRGVVLGVLGPALVAATAYVDPGNFATNFGAGARFGYQLMWVVVAAGLMAMPVQYCAAKLGVVTGKSLPEVCAGRYRSWVRWPLWAQAELVAMATDLAEFIGAALGLRLLFGVPLFPAGLITAVAAFAVLGLQAWGSRPFERAVTALLLLVVGGFGYQLLRSGPAPWEVVSGLVPAVPGGERLFLAVGIVGATVMPHAVYLHSALTARGAVARSRAECVGMLRGARWSVPAGLGLAGLVNAAMLMVAAAVLHDASGGDGSSLEGVHAALAHGLGGTAALVFAVALLASGISSSAVGTYAGQVVMSGFVRLGIPLLLRRLITMAPSVAVLGLGIDGTTVLNASQVVLSFGIPCALVPLIAAARDRCLMGEFANSRTFTAVLVLIAVVITSLNALLVCQLWAR